jgi:hypothetical protein
MNDFICIVEEYDCSETTDLCHRWHFHCSADDAGHAEEQALDHDDNIRVVSVFERVR